MDNFITNVPFTTSGALVDIVDKKIFVSLRDGKKLIGVLRSYDQFANLVLQDTIERIYIEIKDKDNTEENSNNNNKEDSDSGTLCRYADIWRGIYLVRGENVVLLGEIDLDKEDEVIKRFKNEKSIEKISEIQKKETQNQLNLIKDKEKILFNSFGFSKEGEEDDRY